MGDMWDMQELVDARERAREQRKRAEQAETERGALRAAVEQLLIAQGKMLDRWAEADEAARCELWQALHDAADRVRDVLDTSDTAPQTPERTRSAQVDSQVSESQTQNPAQVPQTLEDTL
jgi:hypothetical protein